MNKLKLPEASGDSLNFQRELFCRQPLDAHTRLASNACTVWFASATPTAVL
jgi:hypothetical protein